MKKNSLLFSLLAISLLPLSACAQNLFRTGRPDYARPRPNAVAPNPNPIRSQAGVGNYWDVPTIAERFPGGLDQNQQVAERQASIDRERLDAAWENYVRESRRYQARYGELTNFPPSSQIRPTSYQEVLPISDVTPTRRSPLRLQQADLLRPSDVASTEAPHQCSGHHRHERRSANGVNMRNGSPGYLRSDRSDEFRRDDYRPNAGRSQADPLDFAPRVPGNYLPSSPASPPSSFAPSDYPESGYPAADYPPTLKTPWRPTSLRSGGVDQQDSRRQNANGSWDDDYRFSDPAMTASRPAARTAGRPTSTTASRPLNVTRSTSSWYTASN